MTKVMAFGVFDGLHEGHRSFLRQARALGDHLIVAIAQDVVVERLKGHKPHFPLHRRIHEIQKEHLAHDVAPGDLTVGDWDIVKKYSPDVIAIGYDQHHLHVELRAFIERNQLPIQTMVMVPHDGEKYHNKGSKKEMS